MSKAFGRVFLANVLACSFLLATLLAACSGTARSETITLSVWTYYNGEQLSAFQALVSEFNSGVGREKNIVVEASNVGSVNDLRDAVMDSVTGKVGAPEAPNIFMTYADTAYAIDQMGMLADLAPYLSSDERDLYVSGYLEEGALGEADSIKIFPIAKSVEILVLNKTDFDVFAEETGATYEDLATFEGMARVAQSYYEWTDAQTSTPNDGKAFFGYDSLANYFYIGAKQLGTTIVRVQDGVPTLDFNKATIRRLWDNFYVPFVKGYYNAQGHYRSDDIKTGSIIALVGSSSGATFFPTTVTNEDGSRHEIEMLVLPCPEFSGGSAVAVQQGAGMAVIQNPQNPHAEAEVEASIEFLKWFSSPEQNLQFSISSGYLPVQRCANTMEAVHEYAGEVDQRMEQILEVALAEVSENELYTPQAFEKGTQFRELLENSMKDLASADAAAVREALEQGVAYEEALAPYMQDSYFDTWYNGLKSELEALL